MTCCWLLQRGDNARPYVKQWRWWIGLSLVIFGAIGDFMAFALVHTDTDTHSEKSRAFAYAALSHIHCVYLCIVSRPLMHTHTTGATNNCDTGWLLHTGYTILAHTDTHTTVVCHTSYLAATTTSHVVPLPQPQSQTSSLHIGGSRSPCTSKMSSYDSDCASTLSHAVACAHPRATCCDQPTRARC